MLKTHDTVSKEEFYGDSRVLDPIVVHRALARDHASASAEYLAEFRNDLSAFVTYEMVAQCIGDYTEQAPLATHRPYHAFVDPSGGSSDSMTLAISHREGERIIVDAMREAVPPFSPESVVDDFAILIRSYGILRVVGDRYAGEWPREQFSKRGITYVCAEKTKSDLYRDLLPLLNSGRIVLPKSDRLVHQLTGLERRTSRAGKDSIDHAPGTKDDLGNSVAGCADLFNIRFVPVAPVQTTYTRHRSPAVSPIGKRLEEEARAAVPACLIDFSDPKNQWRFSND